MTNDTVATSQRRCEILGWIFLAIFLPWLVPVLHMCKHPVEQDSDDEGTYELYIFGVTAVIMFATLLCYLPAVVLAFLFLRDAGF